MADQPNDDFLAVLRREHGGISDDEIETANNVMLDAMLAAREAEKLGVRTTLD